MTWWGWGTFQFRWSPASHSTSISISYVTPCFYRNQEHLVAHYFRLRRCRSRFVTAHAVYSRISVATASLVTWWRSMFCFWPYFRALQLSIVLCWRSFIFHVDNIVSVFIVQTFFAVPAMTCCSLCAVRSIFSSVLRRHSLLYRARWNHFTWENCYPKVISSVW